MSVPFQACYLALLLNLQHSGHGHICFHMLLTICGCFKPRVPIHPCVGVNYHRSAVDLPLSLNLGLKYGCLLDFVV